MKLSTFLQSWDFYWYKLRTIFHINNREIKPGAKSEWKSREKKGVCPPLHLLRINLLIEKTFWGSYFLHPRLNRLVIDSKSPGSTNASDTLCFYFRVWNSYHSKNITFTFRCNYFCVKYFWVFVCLLCST